MRKPTKTQITSIAIKLHKIHMEQWEKSDPYSRPYPYSSASETVQRVYLAMAEWILQEFTPNALTSQEEEEALRQK